MISTAARRVIQWAVENLLAEFYRAMAADSEWRENALYNPKNLKEGNAFWLAQLPDQIDGSTSHQENYLAIVGAENDVRVKLEIANVNFQDIPLELRKTMTHNMAAIFTCMRAVDNQKKLLLLEKKKRKEAREGEKRFSILEEEKRKQAIEDQERLLMVQEEQRIFSFNRDRFRDALNSDFITATADSGSFGLNVSDADAVVQEFVGEWLANNCPPDATLDADQVRAVSSVSRHTQVMARAGSGKTTVIVHRLAFLILHCNVLPSETLTMAFNKKAVLEIQRRVALVLVYNHVKRRRGAEAAYDLHAVFKGNPEGCEAFCQENEIALPWISTFHALAVGVVRTNARESAPELIGDDDNGAKQGALLRLMIYKLFLNPEWDEQLRNVMLPHFLDSWFVMKESTPLSQAELLMARQSLPLETLRGLYVKSLGEKRIADWFFRHRIDASYERPFVWSGETLFPDFQVRGKDGDLVVEYLGLAGDSKYDAGTRVKEKLFKAKGTPYLFLYPDDLKSHRLEAKLQRFLSLNGAEFDEPMSDDEVWDYIKTKSKDRFVGAIAQFISSARNLRAEPSELRKLFGNLFLSDPVAAGFSRIANEVYAQYLLQLEESKQDDFAGCMGLAIDFVAAGADKVARREKRYSLGNLRFICLDEYQDYSELFDSLVVAVQKVSGGNVFAVGDNWQSINGFMGAEPAFFRDFLVNWSGSIMIPMPNNYRSRQEIVRVGNALMAFDAKVPAVGVVGGGGDIGVFALDSIILTDVERRDFENSPRDAGIHRLVVSQLAAKPDQGITLLSARNSVPWIFQEPKKSGLRQSGLELYLQRILVGVSDEDKMRVKISTVHSYKGLEDDTIIIIDAISRSFPLVHSDWRFQKLFGQTLERVLDEQLRLFYVAVTRARSNLFIFTDRTNPSPYLSPHFDSYWRDIGTLRNGWMLAVDGKYVAQLSGVLKSQEFRFQPSTNRWTKDISEWVEKVGGFEAATRMLEASQAEWVMRVRQVKGRIRIR